MFLFKVDEIVEELSFSNSWLPVSPWHIYDVTQRLISYSSK